MKKILAGELEEGMTFVPKPNNKPLVERHIFRLDRRQYGGNSYETILPFAKDEYGYVIGFRYEANDEVYIVE